VARYAVATQRLDPAPRCRRTGREGWLDHLLVAGATLALTVAGAVLAWRGGARGGSSSTALTPPRITLLAYLVLDAVGAVALAATGEATRGALLVGGGIGAYGAAVWLVGSRSARATRPLALEPGQPMGALALEPGDRRDRREPVDLPPRWWAAGALAAIGIGAWAVLASQHGVPLLSHDPQLARAGFAGWLFDTFRWLVPPAALVLVASALADPTGRRWAAAVAAVTAVVALEVAAASRALPLELVLAGVLLVAWSGTRLRTRWWVALGAATAALFVGVLFARVGPDGGFRDLPDAATFAFNRTVGRVVLIQPRTIELVGEIFPDEQPFLGGASYLRWIAPLRGGDRPESLGSMLFGRLFPGEPPGGFATPGLLGEADANFGWVGGLGAMAALGVLAGLVGTWIPRWPRDPATRTLAALLTVALVRTYATSLNGALLTAGAAIAWWVVVEARPAHLAAVAAAIRRRSVRGRDPQTAGTPDSP
jgi:hypothetical protein